MAKTNVFQPDIEPVVIDNSPLEIDFGRLHDVDEVPDGATVFRNLPLAGAQGLVVMTLDQEARVGSAVTFGLDRDSTIVLELVGEDPDTPAAILTLGRDPAVGGLAVAVSTENREVVLSQNRSNKRIRPVTASGHRRLNYRIRTITIDQNPPINLVDQRLNRETFSLTRLVLCPGLF